METLCNRFSWADVSVRPAFGVFPWESLDPLVVDVLSGVTLPVDDEDECVNTPALEDKLDAALICEFGAWIAGWRWSAFYEGGPIECWTGPSNLQNEDWQLLSYTEIVSRIAVAIREWFDFLNETEALFANLAERSRPLIAEIEFAAARIIALVVRRTQSQDCWLSTLHTVFHWYFEYRGLPLDSEVLAEVTGGVFESWVTPELETVERASRNLATGLTYPEASAHPDALGEWWRSRQKGMDWLPLDSPSSSPRLRCDGHLVYIEKWDRPRDSGRADRMLGALREARRWAENDAPLTLELLQAWQGTVLGEPAFFRTTDAFAKAGRERYAIWLARPRFASCLCQALNPQRPVHFRAALAYLDVCFFHPFPDGNARLARLVLDALLWREGLALNSVEPSFILSRAANDPSGAWLMAYAMETLLGQLEGRSVTLKP